MGTVFGRSSVAEPAFEVVYKHHQGFAYEIRKYGERFAAQAEYTGSDDSPFLLLARYIGVFGKPENEGNKPISMTAPVVIESKPTTIAMTAPVVRSETTDGKKTMQFILPAEYDSLSKIPKPTNTAVHIEEIPPQVGAVHVYSGTFDESRSREMASRLATQLQEDGIDVTTDYVMENYQFWGYNPPFTLPMFRRNEVWVTLRPEQIKDLPSTTALN